MTPAAELLETLRGLGLRGIERCRLTENRSVMVSFRGGELRVQRSFAGAPDEVLRAIVAFVSGRGAAKREARRLILSYPVERNSARVSPRRRERPHPDDARVAERLVRAHAEFNRRHFAMSLSAIDVRVSRRLRSRLGYYRMAAADVGPGIVIGRRHLRRHGWDGALETLLHEMIHQWQDEQGLPVDHGRNFRRKAREVGIRPSATRPDARGLVPAVRDFLSAVRHEMFAACDRR